MCRRAYGEIRLHRPLGDQLQLFLQHLPGQRTRARRIRRHADRRAGGGDDADGHARGGVQPRLLSRPHAVRLQTADHLQPARGLRQRPQRDDPQRRCARVGQDDARAEAPVRGVPPGSEGDRLRSEGGPPLPSPAGGRAARGVRDAASGRFAARHAGPAEGRAGSPAPGRGGVVPAGPPAGQG